MTFIPMRWTGEAAVPATRYFEKIADAELVIGKVYNFQIHEIHSTKSRNHLFAVIAEAWTNLPEGVSDRFVSPEALRKWAMIEAGFHTERMIACENAEVASRVAALAVSLDEYAIATLRGTVVRVRQAKSLRRMDKQEFQKAKSAVLEILADMIEVRPEALEENAGRAA